MTRRPLGSTAPGLRGRAQSQPTARRAGPPGATRPRWSAALGVFVPSPSRLVLPRLVGFALTRLGRSGEDDHGDEHDPRRDETEQLVGPAAGAADDVGLGDRR